MVIFMDLEYFKEHIHDELCGAREYICNAIEIKPMNASWSKMLVEMSSAELMHAQNLYKMFQEYYKLLTDSYKETPNYIKELADDISEDYTTNYSQVKYIHELYGKI